MTKQQIAVRGLRRLTIGAVVAAGVAVAAADMIRDAWGTTPADDARIISEPAQAAAWHHLAAAAAAFHDAIMETGKRHGDVQFASRIGATVKEGMPVFLASVRAIQTRDSNLSAEDIEAIAWRLWRYTAIIVGRRQGSDMPAAPGGEV